MAFSLLVDTFKVNSDITIVTSDAINTSGVDLLVLGAHSYGGTAPAISDSKSNSWTALTLQQGGVGSRMRIYYTVSPTVGSGHTFTVSGGGVAIYPVVTVFGFSGVKLASPFDQENGAGAVTVSSLATGSVTPSEDNELLVAFASTNVEDVTAVSASFTLVHHGPNTAPSVGFGSSYQIQTTATARNPSFTFAASDGSVAAAVATFKAAAGGGGGVVRQMLAHEHMSARSFRPEHAQQARQRQQFIIGRALGKAA